MVNGERPQFLQLEYLHETFALEREGTHGLPHQLFHKVCLSLLPIRDLYASSCLQITLMFTAFRALILITTPPLSAAPQNTLTAPLSCLRSAAPILSSTRSSNSPPSSSRRPVIFTVLYPSNSLLARLTVRWAIWLARTGHADVLFHILKLSSALVSGCHSMCRLHPNQGRVARLDLLY